MKRTPLYDLHTGLGAKMVPFAGYEMPVQYPLGVMGEHNHTRSSAGLFDVSHMGQIWVDGPDWNSIATGFEQLVPQDVLGLAPGRQRYGFFTNDAGGIEDDLMFARLGDRLFVVVNAACKEADIARMKTALEPGLTVTPIEDRALVAVQGPAAGDVCANLAPSLEATTFMSFGALDFAGSAAVISRSGYTGEDGFEISLPAGEAATVVERLLADDRVAPIGLGARDSLRLEAGLCLYGQDLDATTTPIEAGLTWALQKARRRGGAREGGFPGAAVILDQMENGAKRHRVGLRPGGRAPMRTGVPLFNARGEAVGTVTSGGFGPSVAGPVAMGYVDVASAQANTKLLGEVRGKHLPLTVVDLPFLPARFKR